MNGDYGALCFTKRGQEILRVLLSSLVDPLEKDNATEEGLKGGGAAGSGREERGEGKGSSQGQEQCGHFINLQLYIIHLKAGCEAQRGQSEARERERERDCQGVY